MFTGFLTFLFIFTLGLTSSADACRNMGGGGWNQQRGGGHYSHWQIPEEEARRLNPTPVSGESLINGKGLYQANCLRCHGDYAMGDGPDAAGLAIRPPNLRRAAHHHTDGALSWIIRTGREPMPSWQDKLTHEQIWDLVNYVRFEIGGSMSHQRGGGHMAHQGGGGRMGHQHGAGRMAQRQAGCGMHKQQAGKGQFSMGGRSGTMMKRCEMQTASQAGKSESQGIPD